MWFWALSSFRANGGYKISQSVLTLQVLAAFDDDHHSLAFNGDPIR
jgi:hypothetical protein